MKRRRGKAVRGFIGHALSRKPWTLMRDSDVIHELGYSCQQLMDHLQSQFTEGMSWDNHGKGPGKWNVDHIRPVCSFPLETPLSVINELTNLRPLWARDNLSKGARWHRKQDPSSSLTG